MSYLVGEAIEAAEGAYYGSRYADDIAYWLGERAGENLPWLVPLGTGVMTYDWLSGYKRKGGKSVPSIVPGSGGGDTILTKGMDRTPVEGPDYKRRKFTGDWSEAVNLGGDMDAAMGADAGTQTDIPLEPFATVRTVLVGNPDVFQKHKICHMRGVNGWRFNPRKLFIAKRLFSPVIGKAGDCLSTSATETTAPSWLYSDTIGGSTATQLSWATDVETVAKLKNTAYSVLQVTGSEANYYANFCVPMNTFVDQGYDFGSAHADAPLTIRSVFTKTNSGDGMGTLSFDAVGMWPHQLVSGESTISGGTIVVDEGIQKEAFYWSVFEFRVWNTSDFAINIEAIHCMPKTVSDHSPYYDFYKSATVNEEMVTAANSSTKWWNRPGSHPTKFKNFNTRWRCVTKRFTIAPGSSVTIRVRLPMSLINYSKLAGIVNSEANTNVPGLSSWMWFRCLGNYGIDMAGTTVTNCAGYRKGKFGIQMFQKFGVLGSIPMLKKQIDRTEYGSSTMEPDEQLYVADNN